MAHTADRSYCDGKRADGSPCGFECRSLSAMSEHLAWSNRHGGVCYVEDPCRFCPATDEFGKLRPRYTTQNGYKKHRRKPTCWGNPAHPSYTGKIHDDWVAAAPAQQ